jgi:hypothetical protein
MMSIARATPTRHLAVRDSGAVLVVALCLLLALSVLAVAGIDAAMLELAMAGNQQERARAFYAAEAGIEQALAAGVFDTDPSAGAAQFDDPSATDPQPRPGHGTPIVHCPAPPGAAMRCEYFLRFEREANPPVLPGGPIMQPGRRAYHFVVESVGIAGRGAQVQLLQGFYVVATAGEPSACTIGRAGCGIHDADPPVRTFWRQRGVN